MSILGELLYGFVLVWNISLVEPMEAAGFRRIGSERVPALESSSHPVYGSH